MLLRLNPYSRNLFEAMSLQTDDQLLLSLNRKSLLVSQILGFSKVSDQSGLEYSQSKKQSLPSQLRIRIYLQYIRPISQILYFKTKNYIGGFTHSTFLEWEENPWFKTCETAIYLEIESRLVRCKLILKSIIAHLGQFQHRVWKSTPQ
ncbi:hypothetical protein FGO68_gene8830 [Halteria grandinella]|uniref:Uncharacterized protein n=1 Tax=Halteria grandinella TaxID=5974 RepID=A0A8J8NCY7_HALGN|nr:hypothetical protein FGO68_gene8830 [Halteria grandinella]